jgi:hypothetical protein
MKTLLADQILARPEWEIKRFFYAQEMRKLKRALKEAVVIDAQDIADLVHKGGVAGSSQFPLVDLEDLESVAPPFDLFWVEYGYVSAPNRRVGVLFRAHQGSMLDAILPLYQGKDIKWSLEVNVAVCDEDGWSMRHVYLYYEIDSTGKFVQCGKEDPSEYEDDPTQLYIISNHAARNTYLEIFPAFKAIELLHRRAGAKTGSGESKLGRGQNRDESIKELLRHKTLKVIPGPKGKSQSAKPTSSYRYSLHLTRGHFKTYDESNKLLGRHVGTYWWEPHIRGSKDNGIISKDYKVSA